MSGIVVVLILLTAVLLFLMVTATVATVGNERRMNADLAARWAETLYRRSAPAVHAYVIPLLVRTTRRLEAAMAARPATAATTGTTVPPAPTAVPASLLGVCGCVSPGDCRAADGTASIPGALIRPGQARLEGTWACVYPKETR